MRFTSVSSLISLLIAASPLVNAHFNITYPAVRGPFNDANEVNFCDSYPNAGVRSTFPLTNGLITWVDSHPSWTAGVMISTKPDPTSFADFTNSSGGNQLVVPFLQSAGTLGCIAVNAGSAGIAGVGDGSNITLQVLFNGGDGNLYQCMDLTLSSTAQTPASVISGCQGHIANPASFTGGNATSSSSASASSPTTTHSGASGAAISYQVMSLLGLAAGVLTLTLF